ncbi:hypothetical protein [Pseudomonas sp. PS01301]|uniref:hypothetical protein n=1 Tax=Pseudomonas sp. PS01301 TaxID=2991437 RepID=UPI00249C5837|nr:hypothetical protein [Pseudomonas sp. PS01301]
MIVKTGEVICIASGIYEGYDRSGPFVATREFDLGSFVAEVIPQQTKRHDMSALLWDVPRMLLERGLITELPCKKIHLGAMGEIDIRQEQDDL